MSPSSHRFPAGKRKPSGGGGLYNSEAYNAYYTHSAAATGASAANLGSSKPPHIEGINAEGQLPSPGEASRQNMPHQTINNNINVINYITQIACPHSHDHAAACSAPGTTSGTHAPPTPTAASDNVA